MNISFLIPPVLDGTHDVDRCFGCNYSIYFLPLLGALYPATELKQRGHTVTVRDFAAERAGARKFQEFVSAAGADIYCFYTVFLSQETDRRARQAIREAHPRAKFIFAGPQPTWNASAFLDGSDTYVVRGEPDLALPELVEALERGLGPEGIPGVSYRSEEGVKHNPGALPVRDLDALPIPDRTLVDHTPYYNPKLPSKPHTAMLASRGCSAQCTYCVPNSLSYARELEYKRDHNGLKPPVRQHSAARVVAEMRRIAELGFRSVSIIDDQFLWNEDRTLEICTGIRDLRLDWSCLARADRVTARAAAAMAEDRARCLAAGMLDHLAKPIMPERLLDILLKWIPRASRV
ncbi:MAG TPA: hypothetical protein PLK67_20835, partial [Bryobacteraceae bacterium]|nr:hypothetical protein [Bryobacteraceae bacterium]